MNFRLVALIGASLTLCGITPLSAQQAVAPQGTPKSTMPDTTPPRLFRTTAPLAVTLRANFNRLRDDRNDKAPYRAATLSYAGDSGKTITIPVKVKTHGIWRLKNCEIPPLRWNFANKDTKGTVFHDVDKPKVVNVCHKNDRYEQLLLQEFQLYRVYQTLTPASHRARLLRVTYQDSASGKIEATRYAFAFEDPDQLAERLNGKMTKVKGATSDDLEPAAAALVYAFEYFIANTDFSFNGVHNGELVQRTDGTPITPVAYDFDFSGVVNAPYASVDSRLPIKRVRDRLFRGYCAYMDEYPAAFDRFKEKKNDIYALYSDQIGKLMDKDAAHGTLEYYDEFYQQIKDPADIKRNILESCLGHR
jgi:hypothetical protein